METLKENRKSSLEPHTTLNSCSLDCLRLFRHLKGCLDDHWGSLSMVVQVRLPKFRHGVALDGKRKRGSLEEVVNYSWEARS